LIYVVSFTIGTYTNMKVLSMANVETVIGARHQSRRAAARAAASRAVARPASTPVAPRDARRHVPVAERQSLRAP
jgi:hypothetical protein